MTPIPEPTPVYDQTQAAVAADGTDPGGYTPVLVPYPGEPPIGDLSVGMTPAEPLPGEPGYTGPAPAVTTG